MDGKYIKATFKVFLIMVVIALAVQAVSFGIYWYQRRNFEDKEYIKTNKAKCEKVLSGEEGNLTDYSFCKRFMGWLELNTNLDN